MFYLLLPDFNYRKRLIDYLQKSGITTAFHYQPLHLSVMGNKYGYKPGDLPVTENFSDRILRLPIYPGLTTVEMEQIVKYILEFINC